MSDHRLQMFRDPTSSQVRWRVLGGNNREVARSCGEHADESTCLAEALAIAGLATELELRLQPHSPNRWRWVLEQDGAPVLSSGTAFDRRSQCLEAGQRLRSHLPAATMSPALLEVTHR